MTVYVAFVFVALMVVVWFGISKISIETGLISSRIIHAQFATYYVVGLTNMNPQNIVAMALIFTWYRDLKSALMAASLTTPLPQEIRRGHTTTVASTRDLSRPYSTKVSATFGIPSP